MRQIGRDNLEDIAIGAAVLGTGGGGDPYIGKLMAQHAIDQHGPVTLLDPSEISDDDLIIPSAMMGAPTVMVEKIPAGHEFVRSFQALEAHMGRKAKATMSIEAGGLNSTTPFIVAATLGIPLVDCDGMGRAFPEIQMLTPTLFGVSATPMALADEKGNTCLINTINNRWTETIARTITIDMGCSSMIALYAMSGKQIKEACVLGTMSLAEKIGHEIRAARRLHLDGVETVLRVTGGFKLFTGKVSDIARRTETGFARGDVTITGIGEDVGSTLWIQFQNEFLVAKKDDQLIATVPDLITLLDAETGEPITTEHIRYGFRVVVISIPCDPKWRTKAGLEIVGPHYFGYDVEFVPIEQRMATKATNAAKAAKTESAGRAGKSTKTDKTEPAAKARKSSKASPSAKAGK